MYVATNTDSHGTTVIDIVHAGQSLGFATEYDTPSEAVEHANEWEDRISDAYDVISVLGSVLYRSLDVYEARLSLVAKLLDTTDEDYASQVLSLIDVILASDTPQDTPECGSVPVPTPVSARAHVSATGYTPSVLPIDSITFSIA